MFIIPTLSPMRISTAMVTTASLGARICRNCGSVSIDSMEKSICVIPFQASRRSRRMIRNSPSSRTLLDFGDLPLQIDQLSIAPEQNFENRERSARSSSRGLRCRHRASSPAPQCRSAKAGIPETPHRKAVPRSPGSRSGRRAGKPRGWIPGCGRNCRAGRESRAAAISRCGPVGGNRRAPPFAHWGRPCGHGDFGIRRQFPAEKVAGS